MSLFTDHVSDRMSSRSFTIRTSLTSRPSGFSRTGGGKTHGVERYLVIMLNNIERPLQLFRPPPYPPLLGTTQRLSRVRVHQLILWTVQVVSEQAGLQIPSDLSGRRRHVQLRAIRASLHDSLALRCHVCDVFNGAEKKVLTSNLRRTLVGSDTRSSPLDLRPSSCSIPQRSAGACV